MSAERKAVSALGVADVAIGKVKPYPHNPRKNEAAVAKVAASIRAFGFRQPIVCDAKMVVIAGHTRLLAAQSLGMKTVPVHVARGLTPAQLRAYRLADNRTAQEATWDNDALVEELLALRADAFDLPLTGFDAAELAQLMGEVPDVAFKEYDESAADDVKYCECPKCGHKFPR